MKSASLEPIRFQYIVILMELSAGRVGISMTPYLQATRLFKIFNLEKRRKELNANNFQRKQVSRNVIGHMEECVFSKTQASFLKPWLNDQTFYSSNIVLDEMGRLNDQTLFVIQNVR